MTYENTKKNIYICFQPYLFISVSFLECHLFWLGIDDLFEVYYLLKLFMSSSLKSSIKHIRNVLIIWYPQNSFRSSFTLCHTIDLPCIGGSLTYLHCATSTLSNWWNASLLFSSCTILIDYRGHYTRMKLSFTHFLYFCI